MKTANRRSVVLLGVLAGMLWVERAGAGDILGTVRLAGEPPPVEVHRLTVDHAACGPEPRPSEALLLSPSRGVKNAVVFIAHERMDGWKSATTFRVDQRRCAFVPRVLIIPPGATVEVLNSDGILHNFHIVARLNAPRNLAQPGKAKPLRVTFQHPEIIHVKCDLHGEGVMRAWIVVASNPYYALTDQEGNFRLPAIPPGPHILEVWHEVLGTKQVPVSVGATGHLQLTIALESVKQ